MSVIKLRGLPWSCTVDQIIKFLNGIKIVSYPESGGGGGGGDSANDGANNTKPAVYLTTNAEGRPSGEAFVEVNSEADLEEALKLNNNLMGQRYIEIFRSDTQQLKQHTQESMNNASNWSEPVLRLRGLPYGCTKADIETFFQGLVIAYDGIMMVIDFSGRFNGEAFVQFETISDAHKALERHKQKISNRYIEIFRSNFEEMNYYAENSNQQAQNNNNNSRGGGGGKKRGNFSNNSSRRDSRSDSSMFFNSDGGGSNGNNRFNPYARNAGGGFKRNNNNNNNSGGPVPLMGGGGFSNNYNNGDDDYNFNNNGNNYDNYDDDDGGDGYNDDYDNNGDGTGYLLKMRGLPFKATDKDIYDFFGTVAPINIYWNTESNSRGRPSGECECEFESEDDLNEAMKFDKKYIGTRYIELFNLYESNNNNNGGGNNRRGGFNNNNNNNNRGYGNNRGFNNSRGNGGGRNNNNNNNNRGGSNFKSGRGGTGGGGGRNNNNNSNSSNNSSQGAPQSLNSLMNQSFNGGVSNANSNNKNNNNAGANPNKARTPPPPPPVPPPMPMMMPVPPVAPQAAAMNNFLMTDMAQKMFTAAYSQFQQQQLQYGGYNTGN